MSVDKSKICQVWVGFGWVRALGSVCGSGVTHGTDSACSDATNTVSPDSANQNRAFGTNKYGLIAREYTGINALFHSNDSKVHLGHVARSKPMSR